MKNGTLTLEATAAALGKSRRQVRRYVDAGQLQPAAGGGHGNAYTFKRSAVASFQRQLADKSKFRQRNEWAGVVDSEALGRIIHGVRLKRDNPAAPWLPWFSTVMLWKWSQSGRTVNVQLSIRNAFPPASSVPREVSAWVESIAPRLTALELDYIAGMFIAVAHPSRTYSKFERNVYGAALAELSGRSAEDEALFCRAFEAGDTESLDLLIYGGKSSTRQKIAAHFPELQKFATDIMKTSARKMGADQVEKGRGNPSGNAVSKLLCIHRFQGARIIQRLRVKLGRGDIGTLFALLGVGYVPRAWKARP